MIGIRIDIETRSRTDIKYGVYRYTEDPDFRVLIIGYTPIYRYPNGTEKLGAVRVLSKSARDIDHFKRLLLDEGFQKHAFNANFERISLSRWLGMGNGEYLDPINWHCSAVRANVNGVFGRLDEVARALKSPITKDTAGKALIKFFSIPDRKTGLFNEPKDHPEKFAEFCDYCKQDVVTEAMIAALLPEIPESVQHEYEMDQRINDTGVRHFRTLSAQAVAQVKTERDRLMGELKVMTGVANPNSGKQFGDWLIEQGYPMGSLDKAHRAEALADPFIPEHVADALLLKGAASLSSVTKHQAMLNTRCADGRIRGSLGFYGAHTGREAGRGFQPQNLPRYEAPPADRHALLRGTAGQDAPRIAKGTVRAAIVPAKNHLLVTADYNAIEARVLAGLCGETWAQAEFHGEGKIYEATAATMFGVDKDQLVRALKACGKCGACQFCEIRAKGKVSNLALGYAGGAGALVTMGAEDAGIDIGNYNDLHAEWEEGGKPGKFHEWERDRHDYPELLRLRDLYREASPMTVRFWKLCAKAWDVAATTGNGARFGNGQVLAMMRDGRHNRLVLPSGRSIWYRFAMSHKDKDRVDRDGNPRIDRRTFIGKSMGIGHIRTDTHGGKLTENVTQAVARDVLFDLLMRIEEMRGQGWPARPVLHVHDEVVLEVPAKQADQVLADVIGMMDVPPAWGDFLVVKGEGAIMERYRK
jgi:DNA polymerase